MREDSKSMEIRKLNLDWSDTTGKDVWGYVMESLEC